MNGLLFVIDGTDGTGKNTQATLLTELLKDLYPSYSDKITKVSFPRYGTPGCTMVEKYLNGDFGANANNIDPYTASMLYMIDRSISYQNDEWGKIYREGGIVVADRYYTSNIIHQGAKIFLNREKLHSDNSLNILDWSIEEFNNWLYDTEILKMGLPNPNKIFWMVADKSTNENMLNTRANSDKSHNTDIHELNKEYLDYCREVILYRMHKIMNSRDLKHNNVDNTMYTEEFINVSDSNGNLRNAQDIGLEVLNKVEKYLYINNIYKG